MNPADARTDPANTPLTESQRLQHESLEGDGSRLTPAPDAPRPDEDDPLPTEGGLAEELGEQIPSPSPSGPAEGDGQRTPPIAP